MVKYLGILFDYILPNLIYLPYIIVSSILFTIAVISLVKKLRKAKTTDEAITAVKEFGEDTNKIKDNATLLTIKEFCRNQIVSKENLYKNIATTTGIVKTGALKYDSVLKEVELECMRKGVEFNESFWYQYINSEVNKMKEVK